MTTTKLMMLELVISLAFWAVVFGVPGWLAWRFRRQIGSGIMAALVAAEKSRRALAGRAAQLKAEIVERAD